MTPSATRPALRLIHGAREQESGWTWFCSQCAAAPREAVSPVARVCRACGMGVLLEAPSGAAPAREDAFLVVDSRLTVQALSRHAAALLGVIEEDVIDKPVASFLGPADAESRRPEDLVTLLRSATTESDGVRSLSVRPLGAFGVRVVARISSCGPPRAALVVLGARAPGHDLRVI